MPEQTEEREPVTRFIVEWEVQDGEWQVWADDAGNEHRYASLELLVKSYKHQLGSFHHCPCKYRFVEVDIIPEQVINRRVLGTGEG